MPTLNLKGRHLRCVPRNYKLGVSSVPYTAFSLICLRIADIAEKRSVVSDYTTGVEKSDLTFVRTIRD